MKQKISKKQSQIFGKLKIGENAIGTLFKKEISYINLLYAQTSPNLKVIEDSMLYLKS